MHDAAERETRASPMDAHIGLRIRLRRTRLGMSRKRLGEELGVTVQQVQDYESGVSRVSASRLYNLARALDAAVGFFHEGLPQAEGAALSVLGRSQRGGFSDVQDSFGDDTANQRETQELLRAYNRIADPAKRRYALEMLMSLAPAE